MTSSRRCRACPEVGVVCSRQLTVMMHTRLITTVSASPT
jgi:hypothetical protein